MSEYTFTPNQKVKVIKSSNHIEASEQEYTVGANNRISGSISVQIFKDDKCIGAVPQDCLQAI